VRIRHQVSRRACAEVSAALEVSRRPAQRSQQLQNLNILIVKSCSILRMLLQSLRAHCKAPGGVGSIWKYFEALVRATGVSGRFACGFRTDLHFADVHRDVRVGPMELYTAAGQRWTYTCLYCLLSYRYCIYYRCKSACELAGD